MVLAAVTALLGAAAKATAALAGHLEDWGRSVEARRAATSLAAARNARASDRWRATFEAAPVGMAKVDLDGRLVAVNSVLCTLLGEPEVALLGRRLAALVYPDDLVVLNGPGHPGKARGVARAEVRMICAGGCLRWCELASSLTRNAGGGIEHVMVCIVDITQHKRSQAALRDLATRDPLSGLANRRWFELQLMQHLRLCAEQGPRGAVVVIDLDHFKSVNDTLGHQAGDRLVIEVALSLRRHLRDQDVVARLGGDEFAVILRDGGRWAAEAVARKLVLAVRDEVGVGGVDDGVTVSVGVAPFELLGDAGAREALRAADAAMYLVKRSGRNGYAVAGASEGPHHARRRRPAGDRLAAAAAGSLASEGSNPRGAPEHSKNERPYGWNGPSPRKEAGTTRTGPVPEECGRRRGPLVVPVGGRR
jgi:diguanylate cyclase (GGDEF)-like protein/PAS domain S-box-containing protein